MRKKINLTEEIGLFNDKNIEMRKGLDQQRFHQNSIK